MAERSFEEKAAELRKARDVYMEGEEGGLEGVGIVPGAPGARPVRGRRVEDEVKDQRDLLKGLRGEVQELRKVVSVLKGGFVEVSEAFTGFRKEFIGFHKEFVQVGKEFQAFHRGFSQVVKDFGQFVFDFKGFQEEFSQVSKKLRDEFGKLLKLKGGLGAVSVQLKKEYEKLRLEDVVRGARIRRRSGAGEGGRYEGRGRGYRVGGLFKYPGGIVLQEMPRYGGLGFISGVGYKKGKRYRYGRDDEERVFSVRDWFKRMPIRLVFGEGGGYGRGRYGGGVLGEMRNVLFSLMGPLGAHTMEWAENLYERWEYWKEKKKALEEERQAELEAMGIRKVREIERGKKGWFSEVSQFVAELLGFVGGGRGRGGVVLSAVGASGGGLFSVGRKVSKVGLSGVKDKRVGREGETGIGGGVFNVLRRVSKVGLSDVELVQERGAKIYTDKLHIEAKQVSGVGGSGGVLDMLPGGGLFRRVGRLGRWAGRLGLGIGVGLAFLSGVQEEGLGRGIFRGLGALGGGLGGAKLGALIGTAIAPGIGTAVGSMLGGMLGMLGGEKIADAVYGGMKKLIKDRDWVESLRSGFEGMVSSIGNFLKGMVEGVKSGVSVIGGGVRELGEKVLGVAKWIGENLGVIAREAEAGTIDMVKGAGVVSKTKGDIGGMSAGMYQFTKEAQLKFLKEYGFMKEFEGVQFGTMEWKRRWQEVARKYGERFAKAQQEFAVKEYFVPSARVAERFGIDVGGSRALQEMVFARAIQHGVGGFRNMLMNVFKGMTPEQVKAMSPEEVITKVYDHLIANVDRYWASSSLQVRESVRKRLIREKELLLAMERQKKDVKEQTGLQGKMTKDVKELQGSVKEQVEVQSDITQKMMGEYDEVRKQERGQVLLGRDVQEQRDLDKGKNLTFYEGVRDYISDVWGMGRMGFVEGDIRWWDLSGIQGDWKLISGELRKLYEGIKGQREVISENLELDMLFGGGKWSRLISSELMRLYEDVKKQRGLVFGDWGYGREVNEVTIFPEGEVQGIARVMTREPYLMSEGGIIDVDVEREQEEVRRRVVDVDVRREMEVVSGVGEVLEKVLAPVVGRAGGSVEKVILPGGDAFSKVPLFPEDVGLVMMMMGLV